MAENIFMSPHPASAQLGLNIIDVIPDNQDFVENMSESYAVCGGTPSEANCSAISSSVLSQNDPDIDQKKKAYVQIIEQPQAKALRFRYICEGRSAGSIPGVRSTPENKTYPTIKIMNYKGPAVVVVSCVTVDPPYRPHPHNLVGKEGCSKGVCTITIDNDSMECMFSNLGIQCVKKKDVEQALKLREEIRVDPFNTGFTHRSQPQSIDLNAVRLCFQVFLNSSTEGRFTFPLKPVVSDPIYDKKATSDLNICKLSDYTSCVSGGKEIILLCDKVTKEDIQIRFTEVKDGHIEWEAYGDFQASDVHKQVAISFKTPKYKDIQVDHSVKVFIQLQRPSDKSTSEPRPFEYLPMDADRFYNMNKRRKIFESSESGNIDYIDRYFTDVRSRQVLGGVSSMEAQSGSAPRSVKMATRASRLSDNVKIEPPESISLSPSPEPRVRTVTVKPPISPQHNGGGLMYQNISPLPPPHPSLQPHLQSPLYYGTPSSQASHTPLIDVSLTFTTSTLL
ncbi:Embryonic polarity protein dorsal [Armadillidium nasatum]|uniref:Embryonic polarity protein dorsal n=1 Tax=Armadillidium nasatum TaxID=96803 RepID=A0A5N5SMW8_9CRUS|nr:Embryonic polarity protein dorsal [Armadillidium nasatum]